MARTVIVGGGSYTWGPLFVRGLAVAPGLAGGTVVLHDVDAGARALPTGDLPPGIHAVVARHVANQEMIVEAALNGDRRLALHALLADPLVHDLDTAGPMLDEMLASNRRYLPRFFEERAMTTLALLGGEPVRHEPYPTWPVHDERDVEAVTRVVRSGNWGGYPYPAAFLQESMAMQGGDHAAGGACQLDIRFFPSLRY